MKLIINDTSPIYICLEFFLSQSLVMKSGSISFSKIRYTLFNEIKLEEFTDNSFHIFSLSAWVQTSGKCYVFFVLVTFQGLPRVGWVERIRNSGRTASSEHSWLDLN